MLFTLMGVMIGVLLGLYDCTKAAEKTKPQMSATLDLFKRTYPHIDTRSLRRYPGPLLYPKYVDLQGTIVWRGSATFIENLAKNLAKAKNNPDALAKVVFVSISRRTNDGRMVEMQGAAKGIVIEPAPDSANAPTCYQCKFTIPVTLGKVWKEGNYHIMMGTWYVEGSASKTTGPGALPFEIKKLVKGTDHEINLLTNALTHSPRGLYSRLLQQKEYAEVGLAERILQLDPHDVWAKYALIRKALQGDPDAETAVELYREIQKDFREGKARRVEILANPYHRREPIRWGNKKAEALEKLIAFKLKEAEIVQNLSNRARDKIAAITKRGDTATLISLIRTKKKENLWLKGNVWPAVWAIRAIGEKKIKEAHEPLVEELAKLPPIPGLFQILSVNALAKMHGNTKAIDVYAKSWDDNIAVIKWWLARPKPEDVKRVNNKAAAEKFTVTYNAVNQTLQWTKPQLARKEGHRIQLFILREPDTAGEVLFHRKFDQKQRSISINEINRKTGPLVPTKIDPAKERYKAIVFAIDAQGKRLGKSASAAITFGKKTNPKQPQ